MKNEKAQIRALPPEEETGSFLSNCLYAAAEKSTLVQQIFRETYGSLAPDEIVCPFSFVTKRDLEHCVSALELQPGMNLLDLACGGGGPGLWIARETGANLVGVDFSTEALSQATARATVFGISERTRYCFGSMQATGLEPETFDGVVSIDALWMATDKPAAFHEAKRLLRPHGRLVFTTWEAELPLPGELPTAEDYRSFLQAAGFKIETYEETADWETLQREVYRRWLLQQDALEIELGASAAGMLVSEAIWLTSTLDDGTDRLSRSRRIFATCRLENPMK